MKTKLIALVLTLCVLMSCMAAVTASAAGVAELPEDWKTNVIKATPDMYPDTDLSKPYTVKIYQVGDKPVDWDKIQNALNEQLAPFNTSIDTVFMSWADVGTMYSLNLAGGADIDLIANPSYSFEAKVTDYASRFRLVFSANSSINEQNANNFAFFNGNDWTINNEGEATLQVVDMTGRVLSTETVNGNATTKVNAATGVYMLRLINGNNIKTQKVVVK